MRPALKLPSEPLQLAVVGTLVVSLAASALLHPFAGLALGLLAGVFLARPFDPVVALGLLAAGASFVDNDGGRLSRDLAIVLLLACYALSSIAVARWRGDWRPPGGTLSLVLGAFLLWTGLCTVHGVLSGHSPRDIGLELSALGMITFAWLVGGLRLTAADLRPFLAILLVAGVGHVALGVWSYAVNQIRTGGVWYTPLPGMLAVLSLAGALYSRRPLASAAWTMLMGLFLLHQTISFSRGYWLALLVALPVTALVYAGRGAGVGSRWRRVGSVVLLSLALAATTTVATAITFGWRDLPELLATRLGSSFSTKQTSQSASNVSRLLEYVASARLIRDSPVVGHGMGKELRLRNPIYRTTERHWYIHHSYLWIWVKQGMLGLALLIVLLWHAWATGMRCARDPDPAVATWGLAAAGATLYLAVVNVTTYHLAQVNGTTFQSLLWGLALALSRPPHWRLVWRAHPVERIARAPAPHPLG